MTKEQIKEYTARVAQANRTELVVIIYELLLEKFHLPGSDMERAIVVVEKKRSTPKKYPRKAGMPTKEPLA